MTFGFNLKNQGNFFDKICFQSFFCYKFVPMNEELKNILVKVGMLYLKYGIKSVTMDDVSRELGISKKTLYTYVKDKDELVKMVVELQLESRECSFSNIHKASMNAIEELLEVSKAINNMLKEINPSTEYDLKKYYPEHYQKFVKFRREHSYERIKANIIKGKMEGLYRQDLNDDLIAKEQVSRIESIMDSEVVSLEEFTSPQYFRELFIYHIRGIANEKGIKFLESKIKEMEENNLK
jgi:TetR/AcrR family transcriptional regulator, cholesterol catabolism regulator